MPSTYTTNLGIEKIATGEQSGTWGDTTNTNFDLIDTAVNGIVSITLASAGTSGSPNDLPITDGTASNGRNKFIEFVDGGDLGATAYVQLTPNDAEKIVHIRNSLSGSRSIIVFQGTYNASNDFEIPNGADVTLKFDGAGTGATVTDVNVDLTVTGATIATADINGGTIDGTVIGGSSAAAGTFTTFTSTGIDDNATSTAITIDSSENVGIGTTSPGRTLDVEGIIRSNGTSSAFALGGNSSTPTEGAAIHRPANGTIAFVNESSESMRIDSSGRVGIGNSSPSDAYVTAPNLVLGNTSDTFSGMTLFTSASGSQRILFADGTTGTDNRVGQLVYDHSDNSMAFSTNTAERMRIDSSGNVGIGSPGKTLTALSDGTNSGPVLAIGNTDTALSTNDTIGSLTFLSDDSSYDGTYTDGIAAQISAVSEHSTGNRYGLSFYTGNASGSPTRGERLRIDSTGNVGIGTTSPDGKLNVVKGTASGTTASTSANNIVIDGTSGTETGMTLFSTVASGIRFGDASGASQGVIEYGHATDYMRFVVNAAERMRIDSSGNVGIGTTNPSALLHLQSSTNAQIRFSDTDDPLNNFVGLLTGSDTLYIACDEDSASSNSRIGFRIDGTEHMRIDTGGNVGIGTTSPLYELSQHVSDSGANYHQFTNTTTGTTSSDGFLVGIGGDEEATLWNYENTHMRFATNSTERMRIDSSGNLLVGKTSADNGATVGAEINSNDTAYFTRSGGAGVLVNRTTSDGNIAAFQKDGTTVGSIASHSGVVLGINLRVTTDKSGFRGAASSIIPWYEGADRDNELDVGNASVRWDDIYATNGTIQTSDANEKQDIEALSEAEIRVAVSAKGLLRKFRWKSAVEEKGDDARIHFGIIAQDLQAAFEAEGLDAGRYGMFIHSTWTDEETGEERSRMGVRYSELLAFIIAAI